MLNTIVNFLIGIILVLLVVLTLSVPIALIAWRLKIRKIIKKIPEEVKKEVREINESKEKDRKDWERRYGKIEGRKPVSPESIEPSRDKKDTGERRRVPIPTPDKPSKSRERIKLHKPTTL